MEDTSEKYCCLTQKRVSDYVRLWLIFSDTGPAPFQKQTLTLTDLSEPGGQSREVGLVKEGGLRAQPGQWSWA